MNVTKANWQPQVRYGNYLPRLSTYELCDSPSRLSLLFSLLEFACDANHAKGRLKRKKMRHLSVISGHIQPYAAIFGVVSSMDAYAAGYVSYLYAEVASLDDI